MTDAAPTTSADCDATTISTTTSTTTSTTISPRETLTGDRTCTHCLHPLLGRTIEREPTTGLLYVRCGECGMATALMEYPSATPWLQRMKTVVASGLVATLLVIIVLLAGAGGGFLTASAMSASTISSDVVYQNFIAANPQHDDPNAMTTWNTVDQAWLASDAGTEALAASRWSLSALVPFATFLFLGSVLIVPFSLILGMIALRRPLYQRALAGFLPVTFGCVVIAGPSQFFATIGRMSMTWQDAVLEANYAHFALLGGTLLCCFAAVAAVVAPSLAGFIFCAILPPRDRRLVAWVWEWRGLPVPKAP